MVIFNRSIFSFGSICFNPSIYWSRFRLGIKYSCKISVDVESLFFTMETLSFNTWFRVNVSFELSSRKLFSRFHLNLLPYSLLTVLLNTSLFSWTDLSSSVILAWWSTSSTEDRKIFNVASWRNFLFKIFNLPNTSWTDGSLSTYSSKWSIYSSERNL